MALFLTAGYGTTRAGDLTSEQRLQRVEDEKEIRALLIEYGQFLDTKNFSAYSQLFARDGTWSGGTTDFAPVEGPDAIRKVMETAFAERIYDPAHITNLHLVTNIKIEIEGDRATGYSKWIVLTRNNEDEPYVRLSGRYDDIYIREDGYWKFQSRVATREIP